MVNLSLTYVFNFTPFACVDPRTVYPQSLYADPDPAVFLNADPNPDPGLAKPNLKKKNHE